MDDITHVDMRHVDPKEPVNYHPGPDFPAKEPELEAG